MVASVAVLVATGGVLVGLAPTPAGAVPDSVVSSATTGAGRAPVISVTPVIAAALPRQVPPSTSGRTVRVDLLVTSSEPVDGATATAWSDDGLVVADAVRALGPLGSEPVPLSFEVSGALPGLHPLSVSVSATGATDGFVFMPHVWTSGSPIFTGTNPLYSRTYAWTGTRLAPGGSEPARAVRMLSIVSKGFAFVGLPAHGRPTCVAEGNGCVPYAWDHRIGVLQVGTGIIGSLRGNRFYSDGLVPPDDRVGEVYGRHEFSGPVSFTGKKSTVAGSWKHAGPAGSTGRVLHRLTLRKDDTYRLVIARGGGKRKRLTGSFSLGARGAVTFLSERGKVVQLGTLAWADGAEGKRTLWVVLSGRRGLRPEASLLRQVTPRP